MFSQDQITRPQGLHAGLRRLAQWTAVERFNVRFDTEVGGVQTLVAEYLDGQAGAGRHSANPVILDHANGGIRITADAAAHGPELPAVLARLRQRVQEYENHMRVT